MTKTRPINANPKVIHHVEFRLPVSVEMPPSNTGAVKLPMLKTCWIGAMEQGGVPWSNEGPVRMSLNEKSLVEP